MVYKFVVKTRTFSETKFSTKPELTGVQYTVVEATENEVLNLCKNTQGHLVTHEMMGQISDREADVIVTGKNEELIREIAIRAKDKFKKELDQVPF